MQAELSFLWGLTGLLHLPRVVGEALVVETLFPHWLDYVVNCAVPEAWWPVVILPCCLSRGPQGICVGHGRGKIVTSPAGEHTIPGWPDDPFLCRLRVPSTHLGLQVRKKETGQQFQPGLLPRAAAGLLPPSLRQARGGAEGLEAVWSECNSHLLAGSQETAAQQQACLLKVSAIGDLGSLAG